MRKRTGLMVLLTIMFSASVSGCPRFDTQLFFDVQGGNTEFQVRTFSEVVIEPIGRFLGIRLEPQGGAGGGSLPSQRSL